MPQTRKSAHVARQLNVLKQYDRSRSKVAALGGRGDDVPFEQAFSNLAHAYMQDRAPSLLDHEVGFQLLDRNQENTRAVGVFGFKVGSHWLYAPVFFLSGDLKGHELLYLKNQDLFCPLAENWLNYILNRKPNILGDGISRNTRQMGVLPPDFSSLKNSPRKMASATLDERRENMQQAKAAFASCATLDVKQALQEWGDAVYLPKFLKAAGLDMLTSLVKTAQSYPEFGQALEQFHGLGIVQEAIKRAGEEARQNTVKNRIKSVLAPGETGRKKPTKVTGSVLAVPAKPDPIKQGSLRIYRHGQDVPAWMSLDDRAQLLAQGYLIKDAREEDEVSIPYRIQTEQRLRNPDKTGLYQTLTKSGDLEKCLIVVKPQGPDTRMPHCTVIKPVEGGRAQWMNSPIDKIWVANQYDDKTYREWLAEQSGETALEVGKDRYVAVGPTGDGTLPFAVKNEYGDEDGDSPVYEVDFSMYCNWRSLRPQSAFAESNLDYYPWRDGQRIHLNSKRGSILRVNAGEVYVPADFKIIKLLPDAADADEDEGQSLDLEQQEPIEAGRSPRDLGPKVIDDTKDPNKNQFTTASQGQSDPPPIRPGNLLDIELNLRSKTAALELRVGRGQVLLNKRAMAQTDALLTLVRDWGFREERAKHLLKEAQEQRILDCQVKLAGPYLTEQGPDAPAFPEPTQTVDGVMGSQLPMQPSQEETMPVEGLQPGQSDLSGYDVNPELDKQTMGQVQQATQTGQREVFDTSVISNMLKTVRDDSMIDKFLGDLMRGMDRLGRILFFFYWHGDSFADRYGKSDMPELEDSLRNAFESLGEVILFLKQKTIEPFPEEGVPSIDLGPIAAA